MQEDLLEIFKEEISEQARDQGRQYSGSPTSSVQVNIPIFRALYDVFYEN